MLFDDQGIEHYDFIVGIRYPGQTAVPSEEHMYPKKIVSMYATCNTIHGRSTCDYVETYRL